MRQLFGVTVLSWRPYSLKRNKSNRLPKRGDRQLFVALPDGFLFVNWKAHFGFRVCSLLSLHGPEHEAIQQWSFPSEPMGVKKRDMVAKPVLQAALKMPAFMVKDQPLFSEFVTATAFDDGTPRVPGYYWYKNCLIEHEVTLFDAHYGLRIKIRSRDWNALWKGVEAILGAEDAPWEVDAYLTSKLPKEKKKK